MLRILLFIFYLRVGRNCDAIREISLAVSFKKKNFVLNPAFKRLSDGDAKLPHKGGTQNLFCPLLPTFSPTRNNATICGGK
jgi:hypothetical protein